MTSTSSTAANNRIEQFGPTGAFISVWGFGVSDGEQKFEVCTSACKAGTGKGALMSPGGIAVDNSSGPSKGDVYVVMDSKIKGGHLWKFNEAGGPPGEAKSPIVIKQEGESKPDWLGALDGVAVDASGNLWVYRSGEEPTEGYVEGFDGKQEETLPKVQNEYRFLQLEATLESEALIASKESESAFCAKPGFGVDAGAEHFYLDHEHTNAEESCPVEAIKEEEEINKKVPPQEKLHTVAPAQFKFNATEELLEGTIGSLSSHSVSAIAVDQASSSATPLGAVARGDAYFAEGASISAVDAGGEPIQSIALPGTNPSAAGVAIDAKTGIVYVADATNDQIDVLAPAPPAGPSVSNVTAQNLTPSTTKIIAHIDPSGADTHALVQYGTQSCVTTPSACTDVPASPGADLGAGVGDQVFEVTLEGLAPDTTYYYRVLASNTNGSAESAQSTQTFFTTLPSAVGLLADSRQWEMVSPPVKGGPLLPPSIVHPSMVQAAAAGGALAYGSEASGPIGEAEGNRSVATTQFLFDRGANEWSGQDITTPHNKGEGFGAGAAPEYRLFSSDLSLSVVEPEISHGEKGEPLEQPPLAPGSQEKTIYVRPDPPLTPGAAEQASYDEAAANREYLAPGYLPLVSSLNVTPGTKFGPSLEFEDATPDLSHVVFESEVPLTAGATGSGLYEWNAGAGNALSLVSIAEPAKEPGHEVPAVAPQLGGPGNPRNAISSDGTRVIFTSGFSSENGENESAYLFMRDTTTGKTIQLNAVQGTEHSEPGPNDLINREADHVVYETASADGSKIFFRDTWPLTDESRLHPTGANHPTDLYEYDLTTHTLTDLTVDERAGETADVLKSMPGASADGSIAYFVANGVLAPGATPGHCGQLVSESPSGATCNLYVSEANPSQPDTRTTKFIATLSADDAPDWGGGPAATNENNVEGALAYLTSSVSSSGRYLSFMSNRSLTGYDNEDLTSQATGERLDEEVFRYDAKLGRLVCASCGPEGTRPAGVLDPQTGTRLLVDESRTWAGSWLAGSTPAWTARDTFGTALYEPRFLLDTGQLFFNSPVQLASGDKNDKEDVYEYESSGVGSCSTATGEDAKGCVALVSSGAASDERESTFIDASESGGDAFFLTSEKLLAQDLDGSFDIYDARICGTSESSACLPRQTPLPPPCSGEGCKASVSGQSSFSSAATTTFTGPGNTPASGVLPIQTKVTPKPLTRAQKLAKALKACKKLKKKKKRLACQRQAHKSYGTKHKAKAKGKAGAHKSDRSGRKAGSR